MRNYAVPDDGARPIPGEVSVLASAFSAQGLQPRLEYAADAVSELEAYLVDAGFVLERRLPVMVCTPGGASRVVSPLGFSIVDAGFAEDHRDAILVADRAYGNAASTPSPEDVAAREALVVAGGAVVLARDLRSGAPAGSGLLTAPRDEG